MEGWLPPGGKAFAGEDPCVSEHADLGEKEEALQRSRALVAGWEGSPRSSTQQREQPKLSCQNCEKLEGKPVSEPQLAQHLALCALA